jgi:[acyl-carrier-protein] S-malonyltransferase
MHKIGFVFPGQGSQKLGMLAQLAAEHAVILDTFNEASAALVTSAGQSLDLWAITQNDQDKLDQTHITQPVLLAASVAIWRLWHQLGGSRPELLAGHSLGEYSALVCAGILDFSEAVQLVYKRGQYMQEAVPAGSGAMAAILGLDEHIISGLCEQAAQGGIVSAANINAPGQTVIAGSKEAVDRAIIACKEAGAKRALPLNVSVPSHCALMLPAADRLREDLQNVTFNTPLLAVVQNINGKVARTPDEIKNNLLKQLYRPVQWTSSINTMHDSGVSRIVECGPGKVLGGLIKRIQPDIVCFSSDDSQNLDLALTGTRDSV